MRKNTFLSLTDWIWRVDQNYFWMYLCQRKKMKIWNADWFFAKLAKLRNFEKWKRTAKRWKEKRWKEKQFLELLFLSALQSNCDFHLMVKFAITFRAKGKLREQWILLFSFLMFSIEWKKKTISNYCLK